MQQMGGPRRYFAEWHKSERGKQMQYDFTYMWKIDQKNKWIRRTEADSQTQRIFWWLPDGRGVEGLGRKDEGIKEYKLVVIKYSQWCELQNRESCQ